MAASAVFDVGGVVSLREVAVEVGGVALYDPDIELATDNVQRQRLGVGPIVGHVASRRRPDQHDARPEVGVGEADVPGRVSSQRVAGEIHAVGVNRETPHHLAE